MHTQQERLKQLLAAAANAQDLLILTHNDPDPDAIASAFALRHLLAERLGIRAQIVYKGIIGRAENRTLVHYMGCELRRLEDANLRLRVPVALVDTQPGAANNALTPITPVAIVIDHHPLREQTAKAAFVDVRPHVGATSTLLAEYLRTAQLPPPPRLATALFYGIKTDTMGLGRGAGPLDIEMYLYLQQQVDVEALSRIERAQVPAQYFKSFVAALQATRVYDRVVISYMGVMSYPDLAAEMADLLLRLEGAVWVICMGVYKHELIMAVRSRGQQNGAGQLVVELVGDPNAAGGHGTMAGADIALEGRDPDQLAHELEQRALQLLQVPAHQPGKSLV